jgi:cytochrome c-type biogenesis protein CcmH/NrfG
MQEKKLGLAIAILKINTELYPRSANAFDRLGEAYMNNGDKELAIKSYKKAPRTRRAQRQRGQSAERTPAMTRATRSDEDLEP